ncbi:MAG: class I SAM-dependent methyltransferase [Actinomycetota bacterium]|nr:class I SAM-dependent methyltransferase [Actinomycetota bacterium]
MTQTRLPALETRIDRELEFWRESPTERPDAFGSATLVHKLSEGLVLLEAIDRQRRWFERSGSILELGAGQGWAACIVKSMFDARVIASDVSPDAVATVPEWERVIGVGLDDALACPSFEVPLPDESVDLVFAFQAAHHFGAHRRTLCEAWRLLQPGGAALYLYEPTAPEWLYAPAVSRANRKRAGMGHDVVEDVLVPSRLLRIAREVGFDASVAYTPSLTLRGRVEFLYYLALGVLKPLQRSLPCTADFVFEKPAVST